MYVCTKCWRHDPSGRGVCMFVKICLCMYAHWCLCAYIQSTHAQLCSPGPIFGSISRMMYVCIPPHISISMQIDTQHIHIYTPLRRLVASEVPSPTDFWPVALTRGWSCCSRPPFHWLVAHWKQVCLPLSVLPCGNKHFRHAYTCTVYTHWVLLTCIHLDIEAHLCTHNMYACHTEAGRQTDRHANSVQLCKGAQRTSSIDRHRHR